MLQSEEIKEICERHALTRGEVYQIRSQFASMCQMSEMHLQQQSGMGQASFEKSLLDQGQEKRKGAEQAEKRAWAALGRDNQEEGINVDYFIKHSAFLAGCLPHINKRILVAQGLDVQSSHITVNWSAYLELYCIFEAGQIDKAQLIRFWIKFFDQSLQGKCPKIEYMTLLEELVRGNSLPKPNKTTRLFARMFHKQMTREGCLDEEEAIVTDKLSQAFEEDRIDIQLLCSALGRSALDENFLNDNLD